MHVHFSDEAYESFQGLVTALGGYTVAVTVLADDDSSSGETFDASIFGVDHASEGPRFLLERWSHDATVNESRTARALITGDAQHRQDCGRAPYRTWERGSCGTCALLGWGAHSDEHGTPAPNHSGWARVYVQAREPIPRAWLPAFVASLNDPENERYRDALRRDVATFGWRLTDERPGYRLRRPNAESVCAWLERYHEGDPFDMGEELAEIVEGDDYPADVKRAARNALKRLGMAS